MDFELRSVERALAAGDFTVVPSFISISYRRGKWPQNVFDELATYTNHDHAEILLTQFHNEAKQAKLNSFKSYNEVAIKKISFLLSNRGWLSEKTETHEAFVDTNHYIKLWDVCQNCHGTGEPTFCSMCEAEYPCVHYFDTDHETPKCTCPMIRLPDDSYGNSGRVINKTFSVFDDGFYRYVWTNLNMPGMNIDTLVSGRDYCNLLLEHDTGREPKVHGWVSVESRPSDRNIAKKIPIARQDIEGTLDEIYFDMLEAHRRF